MSTEINHWYIHADLDAFFASVEQLDHPEYRGKPVIVGGLPEDPRSVVSTASYEARLYGVHSAMPTKEAYKLCPKGVFVRGNYKRYSEISWQIMQIFSRFSPDVQQMSIDEAFIDLTGTERLFGPPEETAKKIKKTVKEETGLTISIGLASSKYFAKLSSSINKPDGFYFMKPGTETDYMLSIPIEKIWGIGKKTSARIKSSGIYTTQQLYNMPLEILNFMFGENTGTFLYYILRGQASDMFDSESKSHSISNERTFPEDQTNIYVCETALMELSHSVMFRLLRENKCSRTIFVKIRYEDFTTVSIRQTYPTEIITLDSFFEKVKSLFEQKYEPMRGIRLLGVGFDNVTNEATSFQQNLFDDTEKKKQAVEQAILKFEKKHPELPVRKARVYKPKTICILFFLSLLAIIKPSKIYTETTSTNSGAGALNLSAPMLLPLPKESPSELFAFKLGDANVDFYASGYWNMELSEKIIGAFNRFTPFTVTAGVPVFKQNVNLMAKMTINKRWYFETEFEDEFKKSTIALGYAGPNLVKNARISNRKILYPDTYSSSDFNFNPGGGSNQAPGFSINLSQSNWNADFLFRYDMLKTNEAVFYGMNSVQDFEIQPEDYVCGRFYILPDGFISKISDIYIESSSGTFSDSFGRKYKKISRDQYLTDSKANALYLSKAIQSDSSSNYQKNILISFDTENDVDNLLLEAGSYSNVNSFLGKIQKQFEKSGINLSDYSYKMTSFIDGKKVLVLQSSAKFSPFQDTSVYISGWSDSSDYFVWSHTLDSKDDSFTVSQTLKGDLFFKNDLSGLNLSYVDVINIDSSSSIKTFPFADTHPEIYFDSDITTDLVILKREYSRISQIQINNKASKGSIRIYRNGLPESGFSFDEETGYIQLSKPLSDTDKLYVTWSEESNDVNNGALIFASGFSYKFFNNLLGDIDITAFIPVSAYTGSGQKNATPLFASVNSGIKYENEFIKAKNSLSTAITKENTSDSLLVYESSLGIPKTYYLSADVGYFTLSVPVLNTERLLFEPDLEIQNKVEQNTTNGTTDSSITGFAIPIEIDFSNMEKGKTIWTSKDIELSNFISGSRFSIGLKPVWKKNKDSLNNLDVYLQLGTYANSEGITIDESRTTTWKISDVNSKDIITPLNILSENWQEVSVLFSEKDKALLTGFHDARIIVVEKNHTESSPIGYILTGPYEIEPASFDCTANVNTSVRSFSISDSGSPFAKNTQGNYVTKINWKNSQNNAAEISCGTFFTSAGFQNYDNIEFGFKIEKLNKITESSEALVFTLSQRQGKFSENTDAVKASISSSALNNFYDGKWHIIKLSLTENCIYIDSTKLNQEDFLLFSNKNIVPNHLKLESNGYSEGTVYFDEIIYSGNKSIFKAQDYLKFEYSTDKPLITFNNFSLIEKPFFLAEGTAGTWMYTNGGNAEAFIKGSAEAGITLTKIRLETQSDFNSGNSKVIDNASHSVYSEKPFFDILSFKETFNYSGSGISSDKSDTISLSGSKYKIPLRLQLWANAKNETVQKTQNYKGQLNLNIPYFILESGINAEQKISRKKSDLIYKDYFTMYSDSTLFQFSQGEDSALARNEKIYAKVSVPITFITPEVFYELNNERSNSKELYNSSRAIMNFSFPFKILNNTFNLSWKKEGGISKNEFLPQNYIEDLNTLFSDQSVINWYYISFPIQDLFPDFSQNLSQNNRTNYSSIYELSWKRQLFNSYSDFYIPSSINFQLARDISIMDNFSDNYQFKTVISNQSFNIFGEDSRLSLFKWYKQDEFTSSLEFIIKTPCSNPTETTAAISVYTQMLLYINNRNSIKASLDYYLEQNGTWNSRGTAIYDYSGTKSPLLSLISLFQKNEEKLKAGIDRKNYLNLEIGKDEKEFYQKYEISHRCDVSFMDHYSLYITGTAGYNHFSISSDSITLEFSLGGKMTF
ncbi:MAG: DNA polymerase IV [Treponema sp.]|nr:DNA polymerase IV [Treponema sp.]